jgi:hypothetical protein
MADPQSTAPALSAVRGEAQLLAGAGSATTEPGGSAALSSSIGISPATGRGFNCRNRPRSHALVSSTGDVVGLPCGRNDCEGCYRRKRWELVTALFRDASCELPDALLTLTTRDPAHSYDGPLIARATERVFEWLRRRFGKQVAYMAMVEFSTGTTRWSGGHRRLHLHVLIKFRCATAVDHDQVEDAIRRIWEHHTGAHRVQLAALESRGAVIGYLGGLHHAKTVQRPPKGWEGRTYRVSRNYWHAGRSDTFAAAKAEQADRRRLWRARQLLGPDAPAELVELEVAAMALEQAQQVWQVAPIVQWVDAHGELHVERTDDTYADLRQHRRSTSSAAGPTIVPCPPVRSTG